jgi:hypothetical protein
MRRAGEGPEALPPVAYMGGGGRGVGSCCADGVPCGPVWPAYTRSPTGRLAQRIRALGSAACDVGQRPAVTSNRAWDVGPGSLTARARIGRGVRRVLG